MKRLLDVVHEALQPDIALHGELGGGGMAVVFRGREPGGREVAVKVLRPEIARLIGPERFQREIRILSALAHPHIVPLLASGTAHDLPYLVMPYLGASLRGRIAATPHGLPLGEVLVLARQIAAALDHAHGQGVIHRDIKPENILLDDRGAFVADFGLARAIESAGDAISSSGLLLGTPEYMSPEQGDSAGLVGAPSDLYAFGCLLHEMLTGQPPFTGPSTHAILSQHRHAAPPPIGVVRPDLPAAVPAAVLAALAKQPAARPPSGAALLARLEDR